MMRRTRVTRIKLRGEYDRFAARARIYADGKLLVALDLHTRACALPPEAQERIARATYAAMVAEFETHVGPVVAEVDSRTNDPQTDRPSRR